ncbi:MAG: hypothetical protein KAH30_06140, partial [Caldisericia bacterium]|nr:hypothetical protein [Caldisericia bacterium]
MESKRFEFSDIPVVVLISRLAQLGNTFQAKIESGPRIVSIWIIDGRVEKILGLSNPNSLDEIAWLDRGTVTVSTLRLQSCIADYYNKLEATVDNISNGTLSRFPFLPMLFLEADNNFSDEITNIQPNHIDLVRQGVFFEDIPNNSRDDQKSIMRILCMESVSQTAYTKLGTIINTIQDKILNNVKDYFGGIVKTNIEKEISAVIETYKSKFFDDIFETNISGSAPYRFWMKTIQDSTSKNLPLDMVQKWIAKSVDKLPAKDKPIVEMV